MRWRGPKERGKEKDLLSVKEMHHIMYHDLYILYSRHDEIL